MPSPKPFLPPDTGELLTAVVRRNGSRGRRLAGVLRPFAGRMWQREALDGLVAALGSLRGEARRRFLYDPDLRALLSTAEEGLALSDPQAHPQDLFDCAARGPWLARLAPSGRMDGRLRRRAASLGRELIGKAVSRLPALLAGVTPSGCSFGPFPLDLRADPEEGRAAREVVLPNAGPVEIRFGGRTWVLLAGKEAQLLGRGQPRMSAPVFIPGSSIRITRRVRWSRTGLRVGPHPGEATHRLGDALALLDAAWPEAGREVRAQTFVVVPLVEKGTVSYSHPERPGYSYINLSGKTLVNLADDLLHESAHHRLHGLEEIEGPLVDDDGEPRYWSPWRRTIRPVHGILHAAYTFTWRAALLSRLLGLEAARLPRVWIEGELKRESAMLRWSIGDLVDARKLELLTPAGSGLVTRIRDRTARLTGP
jgi:hypothetical protein